MNCNQDAAVFIQGNIFETLVHKILAILFKA